MTPTEIQDNNRLIAAFMGAEYNDIHNCLHYAKDNTPTKHSSTIWDVPMLQYGSLWEWLMPVVEKIENLFQRLFDIYH